MHHRVGMRATAAPHGITSWNHQCAQLIQQAYACTHSAYSGGGAPFSTRLASLVSPVHSQAERRESKQLQRWQHTVQYLSNWMLRTACETRVLGHCAEANSHCSAEREKPVVIMLQQPCRSPHATSTYRSIQCAQSTAFSAARTHRGRGVRRFSYLHSNGPFLD